MPYRTPSYPKSHDCPMESAGHECLCFEDEKGTLPVPPPPSPLESGFFLTGQAYAAMTVLAALQMLTQPYAAFLVGMCALSVYMHFRAWRDERKDRLRRAGERRK